MSVVLERAREFVRLLARVTGERSLYDFERLNQFIMVFGREVNFLEDSLKKIPVGKVVVEFVHGFSDEKILGKSHWCGNPVGGRYNWRRGQTRVRRCLTSAIILLSDTYIHVERYQ